MLNSNRGSSRGSSRGRGSDPRRVQRTVARTVNKQLNRLQRTTNMPSSCPRPNSPTESQLELCECQSKGRRGSAWAWVVRSCHTLRMSRQQFPLPLSISSSHSLFAYCRILLTLAERIFNLQQLQGETLKLVEGATSRVV